MEIPEMVVSVMRSRGWERGAALLQHWIDSPSNADPSTGIPDLSTVDVAWTRGFSRAASVFKAAVNSKIWTTEDAKARIRRMIERHNPSAGRSCGVFHIDNTNSDDPVSFASSSLTRIYEDRVAYAPMDDLLVPLDALTAALGRFGYYFNISGAYEASGSSYTVHIDKVGVYIRDPFDFSGSQHLGFWDLRDTYVDRLVPTHCWTVAHRGYISQIFGVPYLPNEPSISVPSIECGAATHVTNSDFRAYRARELRGGDFYVFSDIIHIRTDDEIIV